MQREAMFRKQENKLIDPFNWPSGVEVKFVVGNNTYYVNDY
jgi:hypothetical protein